MFGLGEEIGQIRYFSHFGELSEAQLEAQLLSLCHVYMLNQSSLRVFIYLLKF